MDNACDFKMLAYHLEKDLECMYIVYMKAGLNTQVTFSELLPYNPRVCLKIVYQNL